MRREITVSPLPGVFAVLVLVFVVVACGVADDRSIVMGDPFDGGAQASFADAASVADGSSVEPNALCPSLSCPAPYTTCPGDRFRCATNFDSDDENCGSCGKQCPQGPTTREIFRAEWFCQSARCKIACINYWGDCNNDVTDGCESSLLCDPNNCGACGVKCQPGTACVDGQCGCASGQSVCEPKCPLGKCPCGLARCVSLAEDDNNCGACQNRCLPFPQPGEPPLPPNTRLGCSGSTCGHRKCIDVVVGDCNNDINDDDSDGCEIGLMSDADNCGFCGKACSPGETCVNGNCIGCATPLTLCGEGAFATCVDLDSDALNCGACGNECPEVPPVPKTERLCRLGHCEIGCPSGYADCDGLSENGCETFVNADPRNCGACGVLCDGALGQPCVEGACSVAPCDEEPTR